MMALIFLTTNLVAIAAVLGVPNISPTLDVQTQFQQWRAHYGVTYDSEVEETLRLTLFTLAADKVHKHNELYAMGSSSYKLGLNRFADYTVAEKAQLRGYRSSLSAPIKMSSTNWEYSNVSPLAEVNWKEAGKVTGVKDQGQCGSCWAFSAVGAIEGATAIATNHTWTYTGKTGFAERELVDCDNVDQGCEGGDMGSAFDYVVNNSGITAEEAYPYEAFDGDCIHSAIQNKYATIRGWSAVPVNNGTALQQAATMQPISVAIDASCDDFQYYTEGIFDMSCGTRLDHGVLIAGYSQDHWFLVKNSWGGWGDEGYIKIASNTDPARQPQKGVCGINMEPVYPHLQGAHMPSPYVPPTYCGGKEEVSCAHTKDASDSTCCCSKVLDNVFCREWECCQTGATTCKRGTGCVKTPAFMLD